MRTLLPWFLGLVLLSSAGCSGDDEPAPGSGQATPLPAKVTQTIGPEGGTIRLDGAVVTFPPGAVASPTAITIAATDEAPPAGFVARSRIYECGPSGLSFPEKVTMTMEFSPDGQPVTMFWSSGEDPSFKEVGGAPSGSTLSASVAHFSKGFVGRKAPLSCLFRQNRIEETKRSHPGVRNRGGRRCALD
jgi:hypothetical protein